MLSETRFLAIGVDIGGTFTDVVVVDENNRSIHSAKVLTTPQVLLVRVPEAW